MVINHNAVRCAYLSKLVYSGEPLVRSSCDTFGYEKFKWFDRGSTQCFVAWDKQTNTVIICFRGTEPDQLSDILADLRAWPKRAQERGRVHSGFANALNLVYSEIVEYLDAQQFDDDCRIMCTGHSLGAALATIMASRLDANELYTFGSPRVGDRHFVKEMSTDKIKHYRFVNNNDIVTRVPPPLLYRHHGELVYINHYGNVRKMTAWQRIKDQWRGRLAAWKKREFFDGARDHSMDLYHRKIYHVYLQS